MSEETAQQTAESIQIGAFSGYNRRPEPSQNGMTAQFFGENGDDADMVSALSLTKFLDAEVFIRIYLVKDSVGRIMKKKDGGYPKIAEFIGKIQRPKPKRDGMLAQFFAPNGEDADQVNELGKTRFLDSFVFIEVMKPSAKQESSIEDKEALDEKNDELDEVSKHLTPAERKAIVKKGKAYAEANRMLKVSGFLRQPAVWRVLGGEPKFSSWVAEMACCAPGETVCNKKAAPFPIPAEAGKTCMLAPLCEEHFHQADNAILPGGAQFLALKQSVLVQDWAWETLCKIVPCDVGTDSPDPQKIMFWASENGLSQFIPPNYLGKFL